VQNKKTLTILAISLLCFSLLASFNPVSAAKPKLTLNPAVGGIGDVLEVSGSDFAHSTHLTIDFFKFETTTTKAGAFEGKVTVPQDLTAGIYTVTAIDSKGNKATATFTLRPSLHLSQNTGPAGTVVTLTGKGYTPDAVETGLKATFNGSSLALEHLQPGDFKGSFTATFKVPNLTPGFGYTVSVYQKADPTITASAAFNITPNMELPEYPLGALLAFFACAAAFILYKRHHKTSA
jgi:hypothetical protein